MPHRSGIPNTHTAMKTPPTLRSQLTILLLHVCATGVLAQNPATVAFHGTVHVNDPRLGTPELELTLDGQAPESIPVGPNGRFRVYVPEGRRAVLHFTCPGHLAKSVLVGTEHAFASRSNRKKNKRVTFDVRLTGAPDDVDAAAMHLVGRILFLRGSGLMKVTYARDPVALEPGTLLVAGR
ncbi:MAG: hypothetical protein R2810_08945 [Flavobacteriales bacterium]